MDIVVDQKNMSIDDKAQISKQVKADLIDHLYQGCLPGTVTGLVLTIPLYFIFHGYTPTYLLITWLCAFNLVMFSLSALFFTYVKYKRRLSLSTWEKAYSIAMSCAALSWVPCIYLLPSDITRQFLALILLFLATTGYSTGTIGQFKLCIVTLNIILIPLTVWCLIKGGSFYYILSAYSIIYMFFLMGINQRSTKWFKDSLKLKLENTLVSYQANHDVLTDLPNQRLLSQYVEAAIKTVQNTENTFAFVCFSLNRMEMINDTVGHQAGNYIIRTVATRLNTFALNLLEEKDKTTRCIITISRLDTFNILLVSLRSDVIEKEVRRLFSVLDEPFYLEKRAVKVSASLGVSVYGKDGEDAHVLEINADAAMLQAKQFGGNRVEFYRAEINAQLPKQFEIETDLHAALANNQLQVYYQPLIDLKANKVSGMEALIRWPHPIHGFISPAHFIPIAEETGLILSIGEWVLREACKQTKKWHEMGYGHLKVAVNLSEKQLRQENILTIIDNVITETGYDPTLLELEITETSMLGETVVHIIRQFKERGFGLAVDDFGTGYSGLSYLKRFDIDKLKIDQSFIRDIPASNDSMTIVSAIIAMAKELQVRTLAEGVETKEQLDFLISKDCDYIQGYYYSKPIPAEQFTQFLETFQQNHARLTST